MVAASSSPGVSACKATAKETPILKVEMTPQLLGFKVTGDGDRPKGNADERTMSTRLLALCYDLRHCMQGDRSVGFTSSGMYDELAKWHEVPLVEKNVVYSFNVLYPEAIFEILVMNYLIEKRQMLLQGRSKHCWPDRSLLDPAICTVHRYQSLVLSAAEKAASKGRFGKIRDLASDYHPSLPRMFTQWIDLLNYDWAYFNRKQRVENMSLTVRDIAYCFHNASYLDLVVDIDRCVREQGGRRDDYTIRDEWPDPLEW